MWSYRHRPCPPALHRMASAGSPIRVGTRSFAHGRAHSIVFHGIILSCLSCHSSCLSHRPMSWYLQLRVSVRCRGSLSRSSATFVGVIFSFLVFLFVVFYFLVRVYLYTPLFSLCSGCDPGVEIKKQPTPWRRLIFRISWRELEVLAGLCSGSGRC